MAIIETAIAIPVLMAVAVLLAWAVSLGATSLALGDAVRQVARDIARGVDPQSALDAVRSIAPDARFVIETAGGTVRVVADKSVSAPVIDAVTVTVHQQVALPKESS